MHSALSCYTGWEGPPTRPIHCACDTQDDETEEDTMSHCDSDKYDWLVSTVHVLQTQEEAII